PVFAHIMTYHAGVHGLPSNAVEHKPPSFCELADLNSALLPARRPLEGQGVVLNHLGGDSRHRFKVVSKEQLQANNWFGGDHLDITTELFPKSFREYFVKQAGDPTTRRQ